MNRQHRHKLFLSAYACEPGLGSETGVGWHWVLQMSKYFDLWVLTRQSNRPAIEAWMGQHAAYANIRFVYFDLPACLRFWKKGMRGVRTYYNIWQICADKIVKRTMRENDIGIFHHLTYGNVMWKVSSYGRKQFFVWGPVGGAETIPAGYSRHYCAKGWLTEAVRRMAVSVLPLNGGFNKRCANADLILCKTEKTRRAVAPQYRGKTMLFTDVAVDPSLQNGGAKTQTQAGSALVSYIAVGRLDPWRGFDILLESFALALKANANLRLVIVGDGADRKRLCDIIRANGIGECVVMKGKVSPGECHALLRQSDVVLNPSLKEGAVTVSFDSMAMGKPLICIDSGGYTRSFSGEYAIVLPLCARQEMIGKLTESILKLGDEDHRLLLGANARRAAVRFTWDAKGENIYKAISSRYERK